MSDIIKLAARRRSDATLASGHGEASAQPGAQDQPERSEASTDKLIAKNAPTFGGPSAISAWNSRESVIKRN
ncbi:hypothetical protein NBRC116602_26360 [Hyphomicrobiales bacterium 4NK60-0047b]